MILYKVNKIEMSKSNGGKIKVWSLSHRAKVYPHLELEQRAYTQTEMRDLCIKLKDSLPELGIHIYNKSSYCNELNGEWNVCFSIGDPETTMAYTYIIRRCSHFKKTYGCPFMNTAYIYGLRTTLLSKQTNNKLFDIIESKLMELMPKSRKVDYFDT